MTVVDTTGAVHATVTVGIEAGNKDGGRTRTGVEGWCRDDSASRPDATGASRFQFKRASCPTSACETQQQAVLILPIEGYKETVLVGRTSRRPLSIRGDRHSAPR